MGTARYPVWALRVLSIVVTLLVPILLALVSVRLLTTETYLRLEYTRPDFSPDLYGFTVQDRLRYGPYAVQYLISNAGIDYLSALAKSDGTPLFSERELQHMIDVKKVMGAAFAVLAVTIFVLAVLVVILVRTPEGRRALQQGLFGGGLLTLVVLMGLLLLVLLDWDTAFTQFHDLFFASGTWVFDYSDSLIRLYPVQFWQDTALAVGVLSGLGAILIMAGAWWWSRHRSTM